MDIKEIRRLNMLRLAEKFGSLQKLAQATDTPASYLSNIKNRAKSRNKERSMGDDVARKIESRLGMQHGWMDRSHDAANSEKQFAYWRAWRLQHLIDSRFGGDLARFASAVSFPEFQVKAWVVEHDRTPLPAAAARSIEAACGLSPFELDEDIFPPAMPLLGTAEADPNKRNVAELLNSIAPCLTPEQRRDIDDGLADLLERAVKMIAINALQGRVPQAVDLLREQLEATVKKALRSAWPIPPTDQQ